MSFSNDNIVWHVTCFAPKAPISQVAAFCENNLLKKSKIQKWEMGGAVYLCLECFDLEIADRIDAVDKTHANNTCFTSRTANSTCFSRHIFVSKLVLITFQISTHSNSLNWWDTWLGFPFWKLTTGLVVTLCYASVPVDFYFLQWIALCIQNTWSVSKTHYWGSEKILFSACGASLSDQWSWLTPIPGRFPFWQKIVTGGPTETEFRSPFQIFDFENAAWTIQIVNGEIAFIEQRSWFGEAYIAHFKEVCVVFCVVLQ